MSRRDAAGATGARELDTGEGYANDARLSPDGARVGFVRDRDLWVADVAGGPVRRLTRTASDEIENGLPEFIAQEEMGRWEGWWWSPDGAAIAYQETSHAGVRRWSTFDPLAPATAAVTAPVRVSGGAGAGRR